MSRFDELKKAFPSPTKNEELADKWPNKVARDCNTRMTPADFIMKVRQAYRDGGDGAVVDTADEWFLFGAWGHVMREVWEYDFTRDLRGMIVAFTKTIAEREEQNEIYKKRIECAISASENHGGSASDAIQNMLLYLDGTMDDEP